MLLHSKRPKPHALDKMLRKVEVENDSQPFTLNLNAVASRFNQENRSGKGKSHVSPMAPMEPATLDFCVRLARMGQPLDKEAVLPLANDLMSGTEAKNHLKEHKECHTSLEGHDAAKVGVKWCENFMSRHRKDIKRGPKLC